ncbi:MAG: NMD3-related protein [Methanimicrococcus sp.]|nr:NMD3-related protein [Methanimicrococcus sp.]
MIQNTNQTEQKDPVKKKPEKQEKPAKQEKPVKQVKPEKPEKTGREAAAMTVCPECGKNTEKTVRNVCPECFGKKLNVFELPPVLHARVCPRCGSHYYKSKWEDMGTPEEVAVLTAEENIGVADILTNVSVGMHAHPRSPYIFDVLVDVKGEVDGVTYDKDSKTEVRVKREACDMCSRRAGGYFEGIIQIRANNRTITKEEVVQCLKLVEETMLVQLKKGDKLAFVTDTITFKDGADVYIGSSKAGRHVCKHIIESKGGTMAESYTLAGMKDGRDVYRTTFAMKLPEFKKDDVVYFEDKVIEIKNCGKRVTGINLMNSSNFFIDIEHFKNAKLLGNTADAKDAVLVAVEENGIQILDPETFETVTIKKPMLFSALPGSEIKVFKTEYGIFAL